MMETEMKVLDLKKRISIIFSLTAWFLTLPVFSEIRIISPEEGKWCNTQSLVIEASEGEDVYYSFSGADPLTSGFAYDGPVMLDVGGDVELRVVSIDKNSKRRNLKVNYSVNPVSLENEENSSFISKMSENPVIEYEAGGRLEIPFNLEYALGEPLSWDQGKPLYTAKSSVLERYVPLYLTDGNLKWRFIIHTIPSVSGELSKADVPFVLKDWDTISLTDKKTLYKIDDSWWKGGGSSEKIDRSISHRVSWQSASYSNENQINSCIIPPKPELKQETLSDGSVLVKIHSLSKEFSDSDYRFSASPEFSGTYTEALFDIFSGDRFVSPVSCAVYHDGVYQGSLFVQVELNRRRPEAPSISSSCDSNYSRNNVIVAASGKKGLKLFYSVSGPVEIHSGFDMPSVSDVDFPSSEFQVYSKEPVEFFADTEKVQAYRFRVYGIDQWGNTSATSEYSVIIDKYNFYVNADSETSSSDGTPYAPYKNLDSISEIVNGKDFSRFIVKGKAILPKGEIFLSSNVEFASSGESAEVIFPENTILVMSNAGLYAKDICFEKNPESESGNYGKNEKLYKNLFVLQHSAATFNNCNIVSVFAKDAALFNLSSSALSLTDSMVSLKASGYGSVISLLDSKVNIERTSMTCVTNTAMVLSAKKSEVNWNDSSVKISARVGRAGEFVSSKGNISRNNIETEILSKNKSSDLFWKDEKSSFEVFDLNTLNGEAF